MSKSSGSDLSDRPGDDSDGEGSVTSSCSHASEMPYTPDSKKLARPKQIRGKAWIFHGVTTTDADRLHPKSGSNEEGPFLILVSLLHAEHAHWTSVVQHLDDKIKKLLLRLLLQPHKPLGMFARSQGCVESPNSNSCVPAVSNDGPDGVSKIAASVAFISFRFMAAM
jgi:hypothetical protein